MKLLILLFTFLFSWQCLSAQNDSLINNIEQEITAVTVDTGSHRIAWGNGEGFATIYDLTKKNVITTFAIYENIYDIVFLENGTKIAVISGSVNTRSVWIYDITAYQLSKIISQKASSYLSLAYSIRKNSLICSGPSSVDIISLKTNKIIEIQTSSQIWSSVVDKNDRYFGGDADGNLVVIDLLRTKLICMVNISNSQIYVCKQTGTDSSVFCRDNHALYRITNNLKPTLIYSSDTTESSDEFLDCQILNDSIACLSTMNNLVYCNYLNPNRITVRPIFRSNAKQEDTQKNVVKLITQAIKISYLNRKNGGLRRQILLENGIKFINSVCHTRLLVIVSGNDDVLLCDNHGKIINRLNGLFLKDIAGISNVTAATYNSATKEFLISNDQGVLLIYKDIKNYQKYLKTNIINEVKFTRDQNVIIWAGGSRNGGILEILNKTEGTGSKHKEHLGFNYDLLEQSKYFLSQESISPIVGFDLTGSNKYLTCYNSTGDIFVMNLATGKLLNQIHMQSVSNIFFNSNGKIIYFLSEGALYSWDYLKSGITKEIIGNNDTTRYQYMTISDDRQDIALSAKGIIALKSLRKDRSTTYLTPPEPNNAVLFMGTSTLVSYQKTDALYSDNDDFTTPAESDFIKFIRSIDTQGTLIIVSSFGNIGIVK
jgi:WD40 repeat protein